MIKLKNLLLEGRKEKLAVEFLSIMVKKSPFRGKVHLAGGYVRDELLGRDPKDIDIVVDAPNGGIKFAEWITKYLGVYKKNSNPVIYPKFGTAKFQLYGVKHKGVNIGSLEIEAVMTRTEKYTRGSRKPEVGHGTLAQDVERRDFTTNSLLKDLTTGEILDLTGMGKADIKRGIIRTPLNPDVIFTDDPLRMLRAVRFTVKYGWDLPMFMIRSMKKNASQLKNISKERIRDELDKMLVTSRPVQAMKIMKVTGLMKYVFPEMELLVGLKQNKYHKWDGFGHTMEVLKNTPPRLITRLAGLFHDIGKPTTKSVVDGEVHFYQHEKISAEIAKDIMTRLKYPNDIIKAVTATVGTHMQLKQAGSDGEIISDKALRRLKSKLGDHLQDTLDVMHADNISHADHANLPNQIGKIKDRLKDLDMGQGGKLVTPIDGNDIIKRYGLNPRTDGVIIGTLKKAVIEKMYDSPNLSDKEAYKITDKLFKKLSK